MHFGGGKAGVQANVPASGSSPLSPAEIKTIYGNEKISDFKDWFAFIGGSASCLGKSSKAAVDQINKKTLRHLTDMPAPPKGQSAGAAGVIRSQCNEKIQTIMLAVSEEISDFINTQSGAASLVQASWEYQESAIAARAKILPPPQRALFVRDHLREGCLLYLNTVAHEILAALAESARPSFNRTTMDPIAIKKQFEIAFFATYLSKSALKEPKGTSTFGSKAPMRKAGSPPGRSSSRDVRRLNWCAQFLVRLRFVWLGNNEVAALTADQRHDAREPGASLIFCTGVGHAYRNLAVEKFQDLKTGPIAVLGNTAISHLGHGDTLAEIHGHLLAHRQVDRKHYS
jgi:hypothetical protein